MRYFCLKQLKNIAALFFLGFLVYSCGTSKKILLDEEFNYTEFRNSQDIFKSTDGNIKYIDKGEGEVILLLHGVPTSSWLYRKMIDGLVNKGYRVIAPDMLGFGNSDNPEGYDIYAPEQHAKRLGALMKHLNITNWTHIMHDAGGLWTWELFKQNPNKITKLVILNTIIYEEGFKPPIRMKPGVFAKFSMWLYDNKLTTNTMVNKLFKEGLENTKLTEAALEGYRTPLKEGKTKALYQFFTNTCNDLPNYENVIKNINIPVAVIWGKHDSFLKWKPQRERVLADLNINPKYEYIIDTSHFLQEEASDLVNSHILNFLKNN
ncbi:alpha/beta fold hydrolase [Flavobacteriaceae bacterium AU392]|nr:alpha/beta hydrolase [Flavobacteriaceae bacterium]RKM85772.1 alpha/beta fold hydrolase [Flavobacteriaceae bacterium AU392]